MLARDTDGSTSRRSRSPIRIRPEDGSKKRRSSRPIVDFPAPLGPTEGRWTFGGGVLLGRLGLDYAYQAENFFGDAVHSFGLRLTP